MQRSSPLAAMHAPALPQSAWGCGREVQPPYPEYGASFGLRPSAFNFKELSMERASTDYFNLKPIRGSSPTASLAADLSTNFHIDQSPQLPTPRRSLFSSGLFGRVNGARRVMTPPIPSSSPGPPTDSMEISPLPHKQPFVAESQVDLTPLDSTGEVDTTEPCSLSENFSDLVAPAVLQQRPRAPLSRPSLSRSRNITTSEVPTKSSRMDCSLFKFGNGVQLNSPSIMSLEDCFAASPQRDERPQSADSPSSECMGPPPKLRQTLTSNTKNLSQQMSTQIRKPHNPLQRPRKQFRRSLSMFEHPEDVMRQDNAQFTPPDLDPVMDVDDPPRLQLPHFLSNDENLPRISQDTMADVLDGKYNQSFGRSVIVDCRFEYEFEGGHIDGAVNFNDKERLANQLLGDLPEENTLLIFHCEYSACRAPLMAKHIRGRDRAHNAHRYPHLTFPEVYILDGGYSSFFQMHKSRCSPQNYVEMGDKKHEIACERGMGRVKQQRTKLSRAQTFAFGQREERTVQESPTALGSSLIDTMEIAIESPIDVRRAPNRRLASF